MCRRHRWETHIYLELGEYKRMLNMNTVYKYHSASRANRAMLKAETGAMMLKTRFDWPKSLVIQTTAPQILIVLCVFPCYSLVRIKTELVRTRWYCFVFVLLGARAG